MVYDYNVSHRVGVCLSYYYSTRKQTFTLIVHLEKLN